MKGENSDCNNGTPPKKASWATLIFMTSFIVLYSLTAVFLFLQYRGLEDLKFRVAILEKERILFGFGPSDDDLTSKSENVVRNKRQLTSDQYTSLLQEITRNQLDVLMSRCGNASKICLPGPKGDQGLKGDIGLKGDPGLMGPPGPKGDSGTIGTSGSIGLPGPKGEPGLLGPQGNPGPRGEKGDRGDMGPQGPPGVKGSAPTRKDLDLCCTTLAAPAIEGPSNDIITVEHGHDITLPCKTSGAPKADTKWNPGVDPTQQGRYVQTPEGLEITNAQYLDSRMFTCVANNIFGNREKHVYLVVVDPIQISLTPNTLDVTASTTPSLDFLCTYKGIPPPRVQWFHVGPDGARHNVTSQAQTGGGRSTLHISNPDALSSGQYTCNVLNNYETQSRSSNVTVHSKPIITAGPGTETASIGETVILRCEVAGNPRPQVTWSFPKTGFAVPKDVTLNADGSITIAHVDQFSEGDYLCTASNSFGSATASGHLNVIVPLVVQTDKEEHPVTSETYVQLQCSGSGNPTPTLTWQKVNSSPLNSNPSKYLMLPNGNLIITGFNWEADTGLYRCNGTNTQGTAGDYTLVYKDMGPLNCSSTFKDCSTKIGVACGGQCPGNCDSANSGLVFGFKTYTPTSPVCLSGKHLGVVGRPGDTMIWTVEAGGDTFEGRQNNGIISQFSGPLAEKITVYSKRPQLGAHSTISPIAPLGG